MSEDSKPLVLATPQHADELISNDKSWSDGSLHLISSDHVRFKVPPYYLFANSVVFRDMGEAGTKTAIHFTDPNIESATTLRDVLKLFTDWELPDDLPGSLNTYDGELVMRVVCIHHFLAKYECPGPLKMLESLIAAKRDKGYLSDMCDFLYCSSIDDVAGCDACSIMEGKISYHLYRRVPAPYMWALLQTSATLQKSGYSGKAFAHVHEPSSE